LLVNADARTQADAVDDFGAFDKHPRGFDDWIGCRNGNLIA
jgi:hypothetical protein